MLIDVHGNFYAPRNNVPGGERLNEAYLAAARRLGITRIVAKVMGEWWDGTSPYVPSLEAMRYGNRFMLEVVRANAGLVFGYAFINPAFGDAAIRELEFCLDQGMIGLKLGASVRCTSPLVTPLIEACVARDVPVLHHVMQRRRGEYPGVVLSDAADLAALAVRHPQARFILAHLAGGGDWAFGLAAVADLTNVWVDLSGSGTDAGMVERALERVGEDRLLFGTDLTLDTGFARLDTLRFLGADVEKIASKNALTVFGGRLA